MRFETCLGKPRRKCGLHLFVFRSIPNWYPSCQKEGHNVQRLHLWAMCASCVHHVCLRDWDVRTLHGLITFHYLQSNMIIDIFRVDDRPRWALWWFSTTWDGNNLTLDARLISWIKSTNNVWLCSDSTRTSSFPKHGMTVFTNEWNHPTTTDSHPLTQRVWPPTKSLPHSRLRRNFWGCLKTSAIREINNLTWSTHHEFAAEVQSR